MRHESSVVCQLLTMFFFTLSLTGHDFGGGGVAEVNEHKMRVFIFRRVRKISKNNYSLSSCPSAWSNSTPTGWSSMKFDI